MADFNELKLGCADKTGLVGRIVCAVGNPASGPEHFRRDHVAVEIGTSRGRAAFGSEFRCELLVGIEVEDPRMTEGNFALREISLAREVVKFAIEDAGSGLVCNFGGAVRGTRINNDEVVAVGHRSEAGREVAFFVESKNQD